MVRDEHTQTWTHTDMDTHRHGHTQTWTHTDIDRYRHGHTQTWTHTDMDTHRHGQIYVEREMDRYIYRQTNTQKCIKCLLDPPGSGKQLNLCIIW